MMDRSDMMEGYHRANAWTTCLEDLVGRVKAEVMSRYNTYRPDKR